MNRILPLFLTLTLAPLAFAEPGTAPVPAKDSSGSSIDPAATALLDRATDAYAALNGLSMHFVVSNGDGAGGKATSGDISFSRPDKARV